jgi:transmembrane sensor
MKHDPYALTALIRNDEFIKWVLNPDPASEQRWKLFLDKHPEKLRTVVSAREYVILLAKDTGRHQPTTAQSDKMWKAVASQMDKA